MKTILLWCALYFSVILISCQSDNAESVFRTALRNAIKNPSNQMAQDHTEFLFMRAICENYAAESTVQIFSEAKRYISIIWVHDMLKRTKFECPKQLAYVQRNYKAQK